MAPTVPHILLTVHGSLPGGESWTCGLRTYRRETFLSAASGTALAVAVADRWRVFHNSSANFLFGSLAAGAGATVDGVTVREINDEGVGETQYEGVPTTAASGNLFPTGMPNQCALAVSLLTSRAGRTGKGRIYLPCIGLPAPSLVQGVIVAGAQGEIAAPFKIMLDGINTDLLTNFGSALKLGVQSPTSAQKWFDDNSLADYNGAVINAFKVGNVIDTQRRRRTSLAETYVQLAVA